MPSYEREQFFLSRSLRYRDSRGNRVLSNKCCQWGTCLHVWKVTDYFLLVLAGVIIVEMTIELVQLYRELALKLTPFLCFLANGTCFFCHFAGLFRLHLWFPIKTKLGAIRFKWLTSFEIFFGYKYGVC